MSLPPTAPCDYCVRSLCVVRMFLRRVTSSLLHHGRLASTDAPAAVAASTSTKSSSAASVPGTITSDPAAAAAAAEASAASKKADYSATSVSGTVGRHAPQPQQLGNEPVRPEWKTGRGTFVFTRVLPVVLLVALVGGRAFAIMDEVCACASPSSLFSFLPRCACVCVCALC